MKNQITMTVLVLALMAGLQVSAQAQQWALKADFAESCSCNPTCPCYFGSAPTLGHCEGTGLVEIEKGHYGDVRLDGISVVASGRVGDWSKFYVSQNATDEQVNAVRHLLPASIPWIGTTKVLSVERDPVSVERSESRVRFSVPASTVEIEMMKGREGKPIKIQNLSSPHTIDHTQYKSITNSHRSDDKEFSYSGTHGYTARINSTSEK